MSRSVFHRATTHFRHVQAVAKFTIHLLRWDQSGFWGIAGRIALNTSKAPSVVDSSDELGRGAPSFHGLAGTPDYLRGSLPRQFQNLVNLAHYLLFTYLTKYGPAHAFGYELGPRPPYQGGAWACQGPI